MNAKEVQTVQKKLIKFTEHFKPILNNVKRHHWCNLYLTGLMLNGERKSIEPMSYRIPGGNEQNLQQFVNQSQWSSNLIQDQLIDLMIKQLNSQSGTLILDDTSFPKQGKHSVGVSRQYCGGRALPTRKLDR